MIGNEPVDACLGRLREVIEWGGEPHAQPFIKLNALQKIPRVRFDWTLQTLTDMARWSNRRLWRYVSFDAYDRSVKSSRRPDPGSQYPLLEPESRRDDVAT